MNVRIVACAITVLCSTQVQSGSGTFGVVPNMNNGIASWSGSTQGYNVRNFLSGGINSSNCIGFQFYNYNNGQVDKLYFLSDQQIPSFKSACAQQPDGNGEYGQAAQVSLYSSEDNGKTWSQTVDSTFAAASVAPFILQNYKPGAIVGYNSQYSTLSTPFSNTSYNTLQLHPAQIATILSTGGTSSLNALDIESIPYYYAALSQIYIGRVATGAAGLAGLFSSTPVSYNGQLVNNNTIYTTFMNKAQLYMQEVQYALAALGQPQTTGLINPYNIPSSTQAAPPSFSNQSSGGLAMDNSNAGLSVNSVTSSNSSASSVALSTPGGNAVVSLLDTFAGIVLINNVPNLNQNGSVYSVGFGPSTFVPIVQPTPTKPQGLAFFGSSVFIPVVGAADAWQATPNGLGRAVGINYTIAGPSPVVYGSFEAPFSFSVGLVGADSTNQTIAVFNNSMATGTPLAMLNLANFFALPTPWALVVEVDGFLSNSATPSVCLNIVPAALVKPVQQIVTTYLNQQAQAGGIIPQDTTNGSINLSSVVCQSNNQLVATISGQPDLLGVIKLNPHDFPLQFSQAGATNKVASLPNTNTPVTFSMAHVFDSAAALYDATFPVGYHADISSYINLGENGMYKPYPMAYLILQGLANGYLMMSTVSQPNASTPTVPLSSTLQQPITFGADLGKNLNSMTSLATTYQQPTAAEWFATPGFDYLFLRSLMIMRCFTKCLYLTKYGLPHVAQILKNPHAPYVYTDSRTRQSSTVYFGQNPAVNYNVFIPVTNPALPVASVPTVTLCASTAQPAAQTTTQTTTPSNSSAGGGW